MSPQIQVKPQMLDVRPDIIKRGKELFGPDGIDEKNKAEVDERYKGLPESARPNLDSQTGKVRSDGTLLDPLNVLGLRQRTIDKIVREGGQDLINSYDSQTGKYGGLSGWNRTLDGVTDDDITKAILRRNESLRQSDPEFQENLAELERNGVKVDSLTTNLSIKDKAQNFKDIKTAETIIRGMPGGTERLKALGDSPTLEQLQSLETELKPDTQDYRSGEASIDLAGAQATAATTNASANEMNANTGRIQAINADRQAQAEIDFKNAQLKHNYDIAVFEQEARSREANLDRTLRKDLSILGLEDKRDQRQYDRERDERKDRQMMIMQLLGGLKNLGSSLII